MKTSVNGIELIKSLEGCELKAYKTVPSERYFTIGYGHYGSDVKAEMVITQAQANALLVKDLLKFEQAVDKYSNKYRFNQNQFDALVSFAYNCGVGNLNKLLVNGTRPLSKVSEKILAYNKSGGKVLAGLVKRRQTEKKLFDTPVSRYIVDGVDYSHVFEPGFYYNNNPDLVVLGRDNRLLFEHFIVFGMKEHRQAIANFNVDKYASYSENRDVVTACTDPITKKLDIIKVYQHYCVFGHAEKRRST